MKTLHVCFYENQFSWIATHFFFYNFVHGNVFKWIHFHKKIDNDQIS